MNLSLDPGTLCVANGRVFQIDGPDSLTHMLARDAANGTMARIPISSIEPLPKEPAQAEAGFISEAEWKRAAALAKDLAPLRHCARLPYADFLKLAKRHHLSVRQLQRARAKFQADPRTSSLARSAGGRPLGLNCLQPQVDALIQHSITKHYLRREQPPKEHIVARAQSLARRLKLPEPSRKAVLTRIKQAEGWATDLARLGSKAAKQKGEVRTGRLVADRPLDLIQIDHTPADVMVLSDDRLTVLGRPWITVAIDVASRSVVGMYITMDAPSAVSVSLCIEHAVLPKKENDASPGLWPMYGKPKRILVDNGKDFRSLALQRGCEEHGIDLTWRPVRTPHYGAHIERLIGTLMQIAHLLPGTTFSNPKQRGDYDSAGRARLTLAEFQAWMTEKVCRFYHARRHRALGVAPLVAWERGLRGEDGAVRPPPLLPRPLEFRMDFLPFAYRRVRRTGIELRGSRYWHDDITPMLRQTEEAMVRFDPRAPGQVFVRRPDGVWVTAPAIAGPAAGDAAARLTVDAAKQAELDAAIDHGFEATDRIEATAERQTRQARRQARKTGRPVAAEAAPDPLQIGEVPPMAPAQRAPALVEEW